MNAQSKDASIVEAPSAPARLRDRTVTRLLVGIDEPYTSAKIMNCFAHRSDYCVQLYATKNSTDLREEKEQEQHQQKADRQQEQSSIDTRDYDAYWLEYEDIDFERLAMMSDQRHRHRQSASAPADDTAMINSYCIRKGLIRKAQLAYYINKHVSKRPASLLARCVPETHVFELDYLDYLDEALNDAFEVEAALRANDAIRQRLATTADSNNNNSNSDNNSEGSSVATTKKFILKSSMTNKGAEMLLFDSRRQLERFFERRVAASADECIDLREWVIQAYVDRPLLLRAYACRKFHVRVYVLAVGNLRVYVYDDMLALFARSPYTLPPQLPSPSADQERDDRAHNDDDDDDDDDDEPQIDLTCHITNTCVQMDAALAAESDCNNNNNNNNNTNAKKVVNEIEQDCVKRFAELDLDQADARANETLRQRIRAQIGACVAELFRALYCEQTVFMPLSNAWELYGFDFLVDEQHNCLFLEANAFPDFKQTGAALNDLIDRLFYQTVALTYDAHFGHAPVCDPTAMTLVFDRDVDMTNK